MRAALLARSGHPQPHPCRDQSMRAPLRLRGATPELSKNRKCRSPVCPGT